MNKLHYHKCNDCLTAFTTVEKDVDYCDCNGEVFYMGEVHGNKYIRMEDKAPCDGRCTEACGPVCDCSCQGVNHGTGRLVQVKVEEGVIRATGLSPEDIERANKYRIARDYAQKLYKAKHDSVQSLAYSTRLPVIMLGRELNKILSMKRYDHRQNALFEFIIKNK